MSSTILDIIANYTRERIEEKKKKIPLQKVKLEADKIISDRFSFETDRKSVV